MRARLLLAAVVASVAAYAAHGVVEKIAVPGDGGWDYATVDSQAHRLYLSHGTKVDVVDLTTRKAVGEIPNTNGVHGIAIAPDLGRGFTSDGRDNKVTIFDLKTLAIIGTVKDTGRNPDAILYEPSTKRVFTFNGRSADATAIDAASGAVVGTIPLGGKPEFSVTNGRGTVWVNIEDKGELVRLDAKGLKETARWKLTGCEEPSGLALDARNTRLFSVCGNRVMVVTDGNTGNQIATVPTGAGTDGAAFDPGTGLAYASNGEGTLTVVKQESADRYSVLENAKTQRGARTVALDPETHRLYLPTASFGPPPAGGRGRPPILPGTFTVLVVGN